MSFKNCGCYYGKLTKGYGWHRCKEAEKLLRESQADPTNIKKRQNYDKHFQTT